jgi:hypothetical protein
MKITAFDTRRNSSKGIFWRGYVYEGAPKVGRSRVMVIEDCGDYLMVSDYETGGWSSRCVPKGEPQRVNRIGPGRPTKARIDMLKDELSARSRWAQIT